MLVSPSYVNSKHTDGQPNVYEATVVLQQFKLVFVNQYSVSECQVESWLFYFLSSSLQMPQEITNVMYTLVN